MGITVHGNTAMLEGRDTLSGNTFVLQYSVYIRMYGGRVNPYPCFLEVTLTYKRQNLSVCLDTCTRAKH